MARSDDDGASPHSPPSATPPSLARAADASLTLTLTAEMVAPSLARERTSDWLHAHRWPEGQLQDIMLAVSEAVSNSVEHGYDVDADEIGHGGRIDVEGRIVTDPDAFRHVVVTIRDYGRWRRPVPDATANRRRGLPLMRACMDEVQVSGTDGGTTVVLQGLPVPGSLMAPPATPPESDDSTLPWMLVTATLAYHVVQAAVAIAAGAIASSVALIALGLDSVLQVGAAATMAWQVTADHPGRREHLTLRLVAGAFFALAAFVAAHALWTLLGTGSPDTSATGVVLAAGAAVVMPTLAWTQRRTGRELGPLGVVADSTQTVLCGYLAAMALAGLALNRTLDWSWADPAAALGVAALVVGQGRAALRGATCCTAIRTH